MNKYRCLIVDDESIARDILLSYIEPLDYLTLTGQCENAIEAIDFLRKQPVDLIFLDIEMPEISGLSFLKTLAHPPAVIITTAYREFALEGYDLNVVDYLLKPISYERFLQAINKLPKTLVEASPLEDHIYLKVDGKMVKVILDEIRYIEGLNNYVKIYVGDRFLISYQRLSYLEEVLPSTQFVRCHRSFIVNLGKVTAFTSTDLEIGKDEFPIGAKYKDKVEPILKGRLI